MTRIGRYRVTFSIPHGESFVAFFIEDILDLGHAQMIERGLMDGGFESVYISVRTENKDQSFVAVYPSDLPANHVREKARDTIAGWNRSRIH
jgi:hypothetical protein